MVNFKGVCFVPHVSNMSSLEDIKLVPNLATRSCGGTEVYPWGFARERPKNARNRGSMSIGEVS